MQSVNTCIDGLGSFPLVPNLADPLRHERHIPLVSSDVTEPERVAPVIVATSLVAPIVSPQHQPLPPNINSTSVSPHQQYLPHPSCTLDSTSVTSPTSLTTPEPTDHGLAPSRSPWAQSQVPPIRVEHLQKQVEKVSRNTEPSKNSPICAQTRLPGPLEGEALVPNALPPCTVDPVSLVNLTTATARSGQCTISRYSREVSGTFLLLQVGGQLN
jgi:hypothetical protein